jgi:hypothetical protein
MLCKWNAKIGILGDGYEEALARYGYGNRNDRGNACHYGLWIRGYTSATENLSKNWRESGYHRKEERGTS